MDEVGPVPVDPGRINLDIGGIRFLISSRGLRPDADTDPAYGSFFNSPSPSPSHSSSHPTSHLPFHDVEIPVELGPGVGPVGGTLLFDSDQAWRMYRDGPGYRVVFHPPRFPEPVWDARFSADIGKDVEGGGVGAPVWVGVNPPFTGSPVRYPLDQVLLMYALARRGGIIIHGAGIEINGRGYVFAGVSGAGKSTLCRQFVNSGGGGAVCSDDRMVVRRGPVGSAVSADEFVVYGTPWPGEAGIARNRCLPLGGVFFLRHAGARPGGCRIEPLEPAGALDGLMKVVSIPWYDPSVMVPLIDFCDEWIARVPFYDLYFTPDGRVVEFLKGELKRIILPGTGNPETWYRKFGLTKP